jgi:hypothetical protein
VEQLHGRQPGVLQVVEHHQQRARRGEGDEECGHGLEHPADVGAWRAGRFSEDVGEVGEQPGEYRSTRAGELAQHVGGKSPEERAERVDHGLEEQRPLRRVAARRRDAAPGDRGEGGDLRAEPGLPDARLAGEQDDAGLAAARCVPPDHEALGLVRPAGQRRTTRSRAATVRWATSGPSGRGPRTAPGARTLLA